MLNVKFCLLVRLAENLIFSNLSLIGLCISARHMDMLYEETQPFRTALARDEDMNPALGGGGGGGITLFWPRRVTPVFFIERACCCSPKIEEFPIPVLF